MINLITSFFRPNQQQRVDELIKCLQENIKSNYIKKIYLFFEKQEDLDYLKTIIKNTRNKIKVILFHKQPTYQNYLNMANQLRGEICMISNADIWLKKCDYDLIHLLNKNPNIAYSLTRHEHDGSSPMIDKFNSQMMSFDAFIFKTPKFVTGNINHVQNIPGSEHVFKYFMEQSAKIRFFNPCKDIIIVHEHSSSIRDYKGTDLLKQKNSSGNIIYQFPYLIVTPPTSKQKFINNMTFKNFKTMFR